MGKLVASPSMKVRRNFGGLGTPDPGAGGAFDLSTCVAGTAEVGFAGTGYGFANPGGIQFSSGGTLVFVPIDGNTGWPDGLARWTLSVPFNINSRTTSAIAPTSWLATNVAFIAKAKWLNSGTVAIGIHPSTTTKLTKVTFSSSWDMTSATVTSESSAFAGVITGLFFRGGSIWVTMSNVITEFTWNGSSLASIVATGNVLTVTDSEGTVGDFMWSSDGYRLYVLRPGTRNITMFTATTPWDVTTCLFSGISIPSSGSSLNGIDQSSDELTMVIPYSVSPQGAVLPYTAAALLLPGMPTGTVGYYDMSDITTLWTDAGMTTQVTTPGDNVRAISDKSGNGNHLVNIDGSTMTYQSSGGLSWIEYTNTDLRSDEVTALNNIGNVTIVAGLEVTGVVNQCMSPALTVSSTGQSADPYFTEAIAVGDSSTWGFLLGENSYDDVPNANTPFVYSGEWKGSEVADIDMAVPTINQTSTPDVNAVAYSATTTTNGGMRISTGLHDGGLTNSGKLYAFAVYAGSLTAQQLAQARVEMATKSGAMLRNT